MAYEPEESYNSGEESLNDESVLNGEFVPKERIIVSQSAKDAMKRKPYGMAQAASGTGEHQEQVVHHMQMLQPDRVMQ